MIYSISRLSFSSFLLNYLSSQLRSNLVFCRNRYMKNMAKLCSSPGASSFDNPVVTKTGSASSNGDDGDGDGDLRRKNHRLEEIMVGSISIQLTGEAFSPVSFGPTASQSSSPHVSYPSEMNEEKKKSRHIISDKFPPQYKHQKRNPSVERRWKKNFENTESSERCPLIQPFDICLARASRSNLSWRLKNPEESMEKVGYGATGFDQQILRPGMILLKRYITLAEQVSMVKKCQVLGVGPGGFYQPGYNDGAKLRLQMMCLGLNWDAQTRKYSEIRPFDCIRPPEIPSEFEQFVKRAIADSHSLIKKENQSENPERILPSLSPNICIVNFYKTSGKLGLHQDRDESRNSLRKGLPVVSVSIGDSAIFVYGDDRDLDKAEEIVLESGDVLIFGGKSRHVYHGVSSVIRNSAPPALLVDSRLRPGRLNLTFREF